MGASLGPMIAIAAAQQARERVVAAFRQAGATSPAAARPLRDLPPLDEHVFEQCLDAGVVREGAPGTFYVYVSPRRDASARLALVVVAVTLGMLMLLLLVVLVMQRR